MSPLHIGIDSEAENELNKQNPADPNSSGQPADSSPQPMGAPPASSLKIEYNAAMENDINFDDLLNLAIDSGASDLHLAENAKIALRINGKIVFLDTIPKLTKNQADKLILGMIKNPLHQDRLDQTRELDFAYEHKDGTNFRVNIFYKRQCLASVLRIVGRQASAMNELGLPAAVETLLNQKQGLILVTGPTGSGKSTSMQSMLEYINNKRVDHIVTIEDPIEFVFESKGSIFSQREVGEDTLSFGNALRAVLREDPDVVMIGEMRDPETIMAAMNLSETGHLVISTLHTSGAPQTIHRLVNAFPPEHHNQIQSRLADTLIGVLSQRLVPRIDQNGRIAIYELMIVNAAVRNTIRTGEFAQLYNAMIAGRQEGMVSMQDYAYKLADEGKIKESDFINFFRNE